MSQNATNLVNDGLSLSVRQSEAILCLVSGETITQVAEIVGVHRSTIHRWMSEAEFTAEFNANRLELHESADARLLSLVEDAIDLVAGAIADGSTDTAIVVLKGMGLLSGRRPAVGLTDADRIAVQQEAKKANDALFDMFSG